MTRKHHSKGHDLETFENYDFELTRPTEMRERILKWTDRTLGLQMKSVGEVMGIGRSFQEALHKATQSLEIKRNGLGADG